MKPPTPLPSGLPQPPLKPVAWTPNSSYDQTWPCIGTEVLDYLRHITIYLSTSVQFAWWHFMFRYDCPLRLFVAWWDQINSARENLCRVMTEMQKERRTSVACV